MKKKKLFNVTSKVDITFPEESIVNAILAEHHINISHDSLCNLTMIFGTLKYKTAVHKGFQFQRKVDSEPTLSVVQLYGIQTNLP